MRISQQLGNVFTALCEDADTPFSKVALGLFKKGKLKELFALKVVPSDYSHWLGFMIDYQVGSFLRKLNVDIGLDLEAEARDAFFALERQNLKTNLRLDRFVSNHSLEQCDTRIFEIIRVARKVIRETLGPIPRDLDIRFGPGSTFGSRAPCNTIPDKITNSPELTPGVADFMPFFWESAWGRSLLERGKYHVNYLRGNRFTSVEKDALKRRGICVEPSVNISFQLSVGQAIRRRLMHSIGLDLENAQQLHRDLAKLGSLNGNLATMDLSNASDLVSYLLVKVLLPTDWFNLLDSLRSPYTFIGGKWVKLEKFSSMGNGYTFELETLIFYALAQTISNLRRLGHVYGKGIWVFGDDIIVANDLFSDLTSCLKFFGLVPNLGKTFVDGPFRESCGGDFFAGKAVRPRFQKVDPANPAEWISLANGLWSLREKVGETFWDMLYKRAWHKTLDNLPVDVRSLYGPPSYGDLVIHNTKEFWNVRPHPRAKWQKQLRVYRPVPAELGWEHWKDPVVLASALAGCRTEGVSPRGSVTGWKLAWAPFTGA